MPQPIRLLLCLAVLLFATSIVVAAEERDETWPFCGKSDGMYVTIPDGMGPNGGERAWQCDVSGCQQITPLSLIGRSGGGSSSQEYYTPVRQVRAASVHWPLPPKPLAPPPIAEIPAGFRLRLEKTRDSLISSFKKHGESAFRAATWHFKTYEDKPVVARIGEWRTGPTLLVSEKPVARMHSEVDIQKAMAQARSRVDTARERIAEEYRKLGPDISMILGDTVSGKVSSYMESLLDAGMAALGLSSTIRRVNAARAGLEGMVEGLGERAGEIISAAAAILGSPTSSQKEAFRIHQWTHYEQVRTGKSVWETLSDVLDKR